MDLQAYLDRIGFVGAPTPDHATLKAIHRAHVLAIPYENLDVQLGRAVTRAPADAYDKIVTRRRGGWCYEMNGLLGWALEEIGFNVKRLAGAVMRETRGDDAIGNHLVLLVTIGDNLWIADAGFGDGPVDAAPLADGPTQGNIFDCAFDSLSDERGWRRYINDPRLSATSYDFNVSIDDEALLEGQCRHLQSSPQSPFMQTAVVQRWTPEAHWSLRGRVLRRVSLSGAEKSLVASAEDYVRILDQRFGLELPEAASLWPKILARHEEIFAVTDWSA